MSVENRRNECMRLSGEAYRGDVTRLRYLAAPSLAIGLAVAALALPASADPGNAVPAAPTRGGMVDGPGLLERLALPLPAETVSVMLELDAEPAAIAWSEAPTPRSARINSQAAIARVERLATGVRRAVGADNVIFEATNVYAGVAVRAATDNIPFLSAIPGVKAVHRLVPKERDNFIGVPLIDSPAAWTGAAGTGTGVTIGIIDTGIDYTHAAFGGPGTVAAL